MKKWYVRDYFEPQYGGIPRLPFLREVEAEQDKWNSKSYTINGPGLCKNCSVRKTSCFKTKAAATKAFLVVLEKYKQYCLSEIVRLNKDCTFLKKPNARRPDE